MAFSTHDIVPDSPTNNFCTLNVLLPTTTVTVSNGNLSGVVGNAATKIFSTFLLPNIGKWYWEVVYSTFAGDGTVGIAEVDCDLSTHVGNETNSFGFRSGTKVTNTVNTSYGSTYGTGDVVRVLWDGDNRQILFGVNGTMYSVAFTVSTDKDYYPAFSDNSAFTSSTFFVNFGQDPTFAGNKVPSGGTNSDGSYPDKSTSGIGGFFYEPPAGAKALCTANLPDFTPDVDDDTPQDYFKVLTWTGDNVGQRSIPHNMPEAPDLVWIKNRDDGAKGHTLFDSVRGYGANELVANDISAEGTYSGAFGYVDSVDDTNINLTDGNAAGYADRSYTNFSGQKYVGWVWRAAGEPVNVGDAKIINEDGTQADTTCAALASASGASITPSKVSANRQNGFSIVKYVGDGSTNNSPPATVPSGLSDVDFVVVKNLDYGSHPNQANNSCNWQVYHKSLSSNHNLSLDNVNDAQYDITAQGGGGIQINNGNLQLITRTAPVTMIWNANVNDSGDNYIAYCWHSVEGYSKFGSYVGNGSADGPFVYCGFRPAFVMSKLYSHALGNWWIFDSERSSYNPNISILYPNLPNQESNNSSQAIDFTSNGFKIRNADFSNNEASTHYYIFMAFAEQPFKYANAR